MNTPTPLISVYITNHNYARYLRQAIESVLAQTLQNFELIVIDDGSTDNSRDIIETFSEHEKIITIFQHNQGLVVTNNIALRQARGRYIMRLDADDWLDENALQVLSGVLEREPEIGLVFPDYYLVDSNGNVLEAVRRHDFEEVKLFDQPAHGAGTMIRRNCLLELEGYDETVDCQDGWDVWVRFIQNFGIRNVNLPLFYYRQHGKNLTNNERRLLEARQQILSKHATQKSRMLKGVAVIPVRGRHLDPGSIALDMLGDKTVLDWTLEAALAAKRIEHVIVTSPDDAIINHVRSRYADRVLTVRRHAQLAMLNTAVEDTVFHAIETYQTESEKADVVVLLYVECPFRTSQHIDSTFDVMEIFDAETVIGVRAETDEYFRHDGGGLIPLRKTSSLRLEREELFRGVGQIYTVRRKYLENERTVIGKRVGHIVLDERAALYLNSSWNWTIAEFVAGQIGTERGKVGISIAEETSSDYEKED